MFKFNFDEECDSTNETPQEEQCQWTSATQIYISTEHHVGADDVNVRCLTLRNGAKVKCIFPDVTSVEEVGVKEAESQHSDLIPAKYEGGFKIWECTQDLANYMTTDIVHLLGHGKAVLDLGCGAGILGILALIYNCNTVHFQDYNISVINLFTIPNALVNIKKEERENISKRCCFFAGDWLSFLELVQSSDLMYDIIVTSETIYNPNNYFKLLTIFKEKLQKTGSMYPFYFFVCSIFLSVEIFPLNEMTILCVIVTYHYTFPCIFLSKNYLVIIFLICAIDVFILFICYIILNSFGFVAAKVCYFGVGGSLQQFKSFVTKDGTFTCKQCWTSEKGVRRQILHLKFQV